MATEGMNVSLHLSQEEGPEAAHSGRMDNIIHLQSSPRATLNLLHPVTIQSEETRTFIWTFHRTLHWSTRLMTSWESVGNE